MTAPTTQRGNMTADQYDIAQAADNLADMYRELNTAKHHQVIREARITSPPQGPQEPVPTNIFSLEMELLNRLMEKVCKLRNRIKPNQSLRKDHTPLLKFIKWNASDVAQLDTSPELYEELLDQASRIKHMVDNLPGKEPTEQDMRMARLKQHLISKYG